MEVLAIIVFLLFGACVYVINSPDSEDTTREMEQHETTHHHRDRHDTHETSIDATADIHP